MGGDARAVARLITRPTALDGFNGADVAECAWALAKMIVDVRSASPAYESGGRSSESFHMALGQAYVSLVKKASTIVDELDWQVYTWECACGYDQIRLNCGPALHP